MNLDCFFYGLDTQAYKILGCHKLGNGVELSLWAPNAKKVEVITSKEQFKVFHEMKKSDDRGIWKIYLDDYECIYSYRYVITTKDDKKLYKSDPYAFYSERRPANASVMYDLSIYKFSDDEYMENRTFSYENPLNIYEVHPNGFRHENELGSYRELKETLIPYVKNTGYSHIELMPIYEHPFDGSWGYQATGFYSITSRYGTPWDLMDFVNECHLNNIGVILDVSYLHFAVDEYGLSNFDGQPIYEYSDERSHSQWGSYKFNLGSGPVISYLMSSANFLLNTYHFDGLRMDAVSNFIYNDGNSDLGENYDGINFLKQFNSSIKNEHPDVILIAEDSTSYPDVTKKVEEGGLGFDYKWDLGWMNDTLKYYALDPEQKRYHHNSMTFSMAYFYSEKFLLPLSHDEVVHMKKTIVDKMWGTYETKFSLCRNLFMYMFTHPGKKLNFIGNDIAMFREFNESIGADWDILKYPMHDSFNRYFRDLCQIYKTYKAFYAYDYEMFNFKWIDVDNYNQSIFSYVRYDEKYCFLIVLNMKGNAYSNYRIGVPLSGEYTEVINSERDIYSGCNMCNYNPVHSRRISAHGLPNSIEIDIAPYAGIMFSIPIEKERIFLENPDLFKNIEDINVETIRAKTD